jgi:hypothetical protein
VKFIKYKPFILTLIVFTFISEIIVTDLSLAERMDIHTHDIIIQKLEMVLSTLKDKNSLRSIYIRLGDLYSDRARLKSIEDKETVCAECKSVVQDRNKALKYYEAVFSRATKLDQTRLLLQIAHLNTLNGNLKAATDVYQNILANKKKYSFDLIGTAYAGLAEIKYSESDFSKAEKLFNLALKYSSQNKYFIQYKLSWCHFNMGDLDGAKKRISQLLSEVNSKNSAGSTLVIDEALRKTASRDLVTFIAHDVVTASEIHALIALSSNPNDINSTKSDLFYLGQECDRLGNKPGAILVWDEIAKLPNITVEEKFQMQLSRAQIYLDQKKYEESLMLYAQFMKDFSDYNCEDEIVCTELKMKSRSYLVGWIKRDKVNPTKNLFAGIEIYLKYNVNDAELLLWAGHTARALDLKLQSADYYSKAAEAETVLARQKGAIDLQALKSLNEVLSLEIEMSELTQQTARKRQSYEHYLNLLPQGSRRAEVLYQLAFLKYKSGDYKNASVDFFNLVQNEKSTSSAIKMKSADIDLDALAILKNPSEVESHAKIYAVLLPTKRIEFETIARKAAVNEAADRFNNAKENTSEMLYALSKLNTISLAQAGRDEKIDILKRKILIAEKLRDLNVVDLSSMQLLQIHNLNQVDRSFALSRRLWVAELKLNFKQAYEIAKSIKLPGITDVEHEFKLALLAELSGQKSSIHYLKVINSKADVDSKNLARIKLIKSASSPWAKMADFQKELIRTPQLFAEAIAYAFAHSPKLSELKKYSDISKLNKFTEYRELMQILAIEGSNLVYRKFVKHGLNESTDTKLRNSLINRIQMLSQLEIAAKRAVRAGSFLSQAILLKQFQAANEKMYSDLSRLQPPKYLNRKDKREYTRLMAQNAAAYLAGAHHLQEELRKIWSHSEEYKKLIKFATADVYEVRSVAKFELKLLADFAPDSESDEIQIAIVSSPNMPSFNDIRDAEKELQNDPFDKNNIEQLKKLAEIKGVGSMVSFLDARLYNLSQERM